MLRKLRKVLRDLQGLFTFKTKSYAHLMSLWEFS